MRTIEKIVSVAHGGDTVNTQIMTETTKADHFLRGADLLHYSDTVGHVALPAMVGNEKVRM